jgi:hypothetical protein
MFRRGGPSADSDQLEPPQTKVVAMEIEIRPSQSPRRRRYVFLDLAAVISVTLIALAPPAKADQGDKAGWSVSIDPRKRAFLHYVAVMDGGRVLTIGCLRDVDSFTIFSTGLKTGLNSNATATLNLSNGAARYAVEGKVEIDQETSTQTFDVDIDADANGLRKIGETLLPVLQGSGPITLSVGAVELTLPTAGLSQSLSRFKSICQGFR